MATGDPLEIPVNFQDNTGSTVQGFQQLASVTKQIRDDVEAIDTAISGVTDRADKLRGYFQENLDVVTGIKSILEIVSTQAQANQATFSNLVMQLQEMMNSARGLGGNANMGQAMQMLGFGGNTGAGYFGNTGSGGYSQSITSSVDFSTDPNVQRTSINNRFAGKSRDFSDLMSGISGGNGNNIVPPNAPPSGGYDEEDDGRKRVFGNALSQIISPTVNNQVPNDSLQTRLQAQLKNNYSNIADSIIAQKKEGRAAEVAYRQSTNLITRTLGNRAGSFYKSVLGNLGIDRETLRQAQAEAKYENVLDANGNPTYYPGSTIPIQQRTSEIVSGGTEDKMLKIADHITSIFGSKLLTKFTEFAGYANIASGIYGGAVAIANQARQITGFAQAQGQNVGQVDYGRSAGQALSAFVQSGFNLNPSFSMADVMQAQNNAQALGLRGGNIQQYVNNALQFKTQYGLNAQQTQQIIGGGLAAGVNMGDTANAFAYVRQLENNTQTSTAYGNQAFMTGMSQYAAGGATGVVAAQLGAQAAQFGAGNFVLQAQGATGTELLGTQLGNALMAQALGTSYMGLYATERKSTSAQLQTATYTSDEQILHWAQIDTTTDYQGSQKKFDDKNAGQYMILSAIMSQPSMGSAINKQGDTPQHAGNWAWGVVKQVQTAKKYGAPVAFTDATASGNVKKIVDQTNQAAPGGQLRLRGTSSEYVFKQEQEHALEALNKVTQGTINVPKSVYQEAYNAYQSGDYTTATQDIYGYKAPSNNNNASTSHVSLSFNPSTAQALSFSMQNNAAGYTTGTIPLTKIPKHL